MQHPDHPRLPPSPLLPTLLLLLPALHPLLPSSCCSATGVLQLALLLLLPLSLLPPPLPPPLLPPSLCCCHRRAVQEAPRSARTPKSEKAVVRFISPLEAHRAVRERQGGFCGNNQVQLRLLQ